ncbi:MAG: hypothetical protein QM302_07860 [Acidobacteriota bacterium]|nr:hypothetical protein [Acidobacteriota bacterium]
MLDETTGYDDRSADTPDDAALPKPQIEIIVDGNSVFKPSMKTYFVDEYDADAGEFSGHVTGVMGEYCSCDTVAVPHTVCTCESVCTCVSVCTCESVCSCVDVCTCDNVCTCESVCSCDGYSSCSCVGYTSSSGGGWVSCGSPCACVPVH